MYRVGNQLGGIHVLVILFGNGRGNHTELRVRTRDNRISWVGEGECYEAVGQFREHVKMFA